MKMKQLILMLVMACCTWQAAAQHRGHLRARLTEESVIKDSTGREYPASIWSLLVNSGDYYLLPEKPDDPQSAFLLYKTDSARLAMIRDIHPPESPNFSNGEKFGRLKEKDISGATVDSKGKILVLNYWFLNCGPCVKEMPKLNELVKEYAADSSVIFAAITPDSESAVETFLVNNPFDYHIISFGQDLIRQHRINGFPQHVVVDSEGKVVYHSIGASPFINLWLKKAIEECR